jgi:high-affinity iron transporter
MKHGKVADDFDMTINSIRFNVAWNVWREVAECGVFLLPFFLQGEGVASLPVSALVGTVVGLAAGFGIYYANRTLKDKFYLAVFTSLLLAFLATGLFVGGCHEFEEVWGETPNVWRIDNDFWNHKELPMAILKPFGYSSSRSVLQITTFWCWLAFSGLCHFYKIRKTSKINQQMTLVASGKVEMANQETMDVEKASSPATSVAEGEEASPTNRVADANLAV